MKQFYNYKVRSKLLICFIIVAVICGLMGAYAVKNIANMNNNDTVLYENMTIPLSEIGKISTEFQMLRVDSRDLIINTDAAKKQQIVDDIKLRRSNLDKLYSSFEKSIISNEVKTEFKNLVEADKTYDAAIDKMMNYALVNQNNEAYSILTNDGSKAAAKQEEIINKLMTLKIDGAKNKSDSNDAETRNTTLTMIGIIVFVMILSVLIGLFISSIISKPLKRAMIMIEEMSKGHFDQRLNLNTKDEIGQMAQAMDTFASNLQTNVIGVLRKVSAGDISMDIVIKDNKDEITPAIKMTVDTIRNLNTEINRLIQATTEGKLDVRGSIDGYQGSWKELILGINGLIDAFVGPINVTAEYVDRISKGNIPPRITDTYYGDFNEIKNCLNGCIDVMNGLLQETDMLITATQQGKLDMRGNPEAFSGDWGTLVKGINGLIDAFVAPIQITSNYVEKIGKGEIPSKITDEYYGDFNNIKNSINSCIDGMGGLVEGVDVLATMKMNDFTRRIYGDHLGIYAEMVASINNISDKFVTITKTVSNISAGVLSDLSWLEELGKRSENDEIIPSLITLIKNIESLIDETNALSKSAIEGELVKRGDVSRFEGKYKLVIDGINKTLDAVIKPINEATSVLKEMENGNLEAFVTGDYKGDHAIIKNAMNATIENLRSYINDISTVLEQIGEGNLNLSITADYKGDFVKVKNSLNNILSSLNQVMSDINESADQVNTGSRQVSDGSQTLSQGATEQASSVEQLTASVAEVAENIKGNAASANEANELTTSVKQIAEMGNKHMSEMLQAMGEINESSNNISKIIKVIDDIAFQTNILALNAAVEAARAGQHGKGFAVVAEEVRNLAARSAEAAKETTELIQGSINKAAAGTDIANNTATALNDIVKGVGKTVDVISEIARSSNEQAMGIAQINTGLAQVSQVVQNNAATAEESAASSEELSSQAELLKEMVGRFKLRKGFGVDIVPKMLKDSNTNSVNVKKSAPRILLNNEEYDKY